ncbi:MAG: MurR/RpiR family transcriptional regulator [Coriobacteriia bacterium]|nr:MurR/RpiR family transcriptional regulator [Coriobacteriia bacterium]
MNLEARIDAHYDELTPAERAAASLAVRNKAQLAGLGSAEAAHLLGTSRASLSRMVKKLGIESYAEFKVLLKGDEARGRGVVGLSTQSIADGYRALLRDLVSRDYRSACELIAAAGTVYLYGSGNEQKAVADKFRRIFLTHGKCCVSLFDVGELEFAVGRFEPGDLLVAISLSGEAESLLSFVRRAQAAGIRTLSVTRWQNNSLARMCDESVYVGTKTVFSDIAPSYEMSAAFYILLDALSIRYLEFCAEKGGVGPQSKAQTPPASAPLREGVTCR